MTKTRLQIAIVDDEPRVRTALRRLLAIADYDVSLFASGEEFLASLSTSHPQCAILDIHMPGLSGLEVEVAMLIRNCDVPVIFITASDEPILHQVLLSRRRILLNKPFSDQQLIGAVESAIHGRSLSNAEPTVRN